MRELTDEELLVASEEDWAFYHKAIEGLPTMAGKNNDGLDKFGIPIPFHSGPHIIRHFKKALEITGARYILEIGLCCGVGSALWLNLNKFIEVYSLDISARDETIDAGLFLIEKFRGRFDYRICDSAKAFPLLKIYPMFQLAWIDGGHDEISVTADIQLCKDLKIPYLLFDDTYSRFGPGVMPSIAKFPLELVEDMNNLKLYKWQNS